jgi:hypothetical protein
MPVCISELRLRRRAHNLIVEIAHPANSNVGKAIHAVDGAETGQGVDAASWTVGGATDGSKDI